MTDTGRVTRQAPARPLSTSSSSSPSSSTSTSSSPAWEKVGAAPRDHLAVTHRVQERIAEKQRIERRHRMTTGGRRLLFVLIALGAAWLALLSPVFSLDPQKVELYGVGVVVDPALVTATIAPYEGRSLAVINVAHLRHQILDLPGVRDAVVERVWPAGLRVEITTRIPVAAIPDPAGGYTLLDDQAVQVAHLAEVPPDVPVVNIPIGAGSERILAAVIAVVNELPGDVRARVSNVAAQTEDSVTFQLRDGPRVEWGSAEQSALKARVLTVMLQSPNVATVGVIDVSAPTLPITRAE